MSNRTRDVVLLTGASAGLGLAIARQLIAEDRYTLVLTAREGSLGRFAEEGIVPGEHLWLRALDILDYPQMRALVAEVEAALGGVDILVNNAGISERSTVEDAGDDSRHRQLDVNYLAPFELIAQVLPHMRRQRAGRIVNVSSAGGFMAMPTMSAYSASKFALEAASEALWYELRPWGVAVTLAVPGFINSDGYLKVAEHPRAGDARAVYFEQYRGMRDLVRFSMRRTVATNESVAGRIVQLLRLPDPPLRAHLTTEARLFFWMRRLLPATFYHGVFALLLGGLQAWGRLSTTGWLLPASRGPEVA
jgi:NAD(P)-dependent dehydrogenase (short-subunit alcohol dehydrogenase family)